MEKISYSAISEGIYPYAIKPVEEVSSSGLEADVEREHLQNTFGPDYILEIKCFTPSGIPVVEEGQ
jgi:hypothetical protein